MTECNTTYQNEHTRFEFVNLIEELNACISIAEKMVSSQLVKESLLAFQHQLVSIKHHIEIKQCDAQTFSDMTSRLQQIRHNLPTQALSVAQEQLLGHCQSAAQLHLARSISGRLIHYLRQSASDCPAHQQLVVYVENLFLVLADLAKQEDDLYYQNHLVDQVVARCQELLNTSKKDHTDIYEEAWDIVCKARKQAQVEGIPVVITVVDQSAEVVMTYRMEDALLVSSDMAYKKAYTAIGMKMQSKDLAPLTQPGQWLFNLETMTDNKVVSLAGGVPIYNGDRIIGAIGISGGSADQDQRIAEAALV